MQDSSQIICQPLRLHTPELEDPGRDTDKPIDLACLLNMTTLDNDIIILNYFNQEFIKLYT